MREEIKGGNCGIRGEYCERREGSEMRRGDCERRGRDKRRGLWEK